MTRLNNDIAGISMPDHIKKLPISERGYPIPWFVPKDRDGKPITQAADPNKRLTAVRSDRCWVCGEPRGVYKAFVIGPMCMVNRITAEPPCHLDCAEYTVRACPFLAKPNMRRNPSDIPDKKPSAGLMLERNPGVSVIWLTKKMQRVPDQLGSWLIKVGDPVSVRFFREGREATREEIVASIESGMPLLRRYAIGRKESELLDKQYDQAMTYLPAA